MSKLEKKNHYERVFSVDDEGNITSWGLKSKREEIVIQERKELTDKQRAYLNRNDELKSYCKSLGGYVHMLYVKNELLFNDINIDESNISRLIYLATYIDYNNREENVLVRYNKNNKIEYLTKRDVKRMMGLSDPTFRGFYKCLIDNNLLFEANDKLYITNKYFGKGESSFDNKSYTRVFVNTTRRVYEGCTSRQHKKLGYVFQLIPYLNYETNIICSNPNECDRNKLNRLGLRDICELLNIDTDPKSMPRIEHDLYDIEIKIDGDKYFLFSRVIVKGKCGHNDYFVINPAVVWCGNDVDDAKETIQWLYFKSNKR